MKLSCDAKLLAKALGAVARAVPQRTTLPVLGHVLLEAAGERLTLTTTDLEIGVRTSVPAEVAEAGATTVPAKLMAGVVGQMPEGPVSVALEDTQLRIGAGRYGTTLRTMSADEFPPGPQPADEEPLRLPREDLLTAIEQVKPAVSTDSQHRPVLTGVLLSFEGRTLTLVATDAWRLVKRLVEAGERARGEPAVVPAKALGEAVRLFREEPGDVEVRFSPARNQVFFRCGATEVASRLLEGQYPRYEQVIPTTSSTVARAPREDLVRAVRVVSVVAESTDARPVSLRVGEGSIDLTSRALDVGDAEASLEAEVEGEPAKIALNSRYLLDALTALDAEQAEVRLNGPLSPALIRGVGVDNCTCIVMPVRITAPPQAASGSTAA
jgi:DNA polymerase III subunit beta